MRRRKYSIFKIILICSLLIGFIPVKVHAAEGSGSCGANLNWSLSGSTLSITGSGDMTDYRDNHLAPWADSAEQITSVQLPSGLTSVGDFAFYGCSNLISVSIPSSVAEIGSYAFAECINLRTFNMGSGVAAVGTAAFQQCESLAAVSLPSSLKTIGSKAFYRCESLTAVTVPSSVDSMGSSVFAYCTGLVRATVNAPLGSLPKWTFYGCTSLANVSLASTFTSTGEYAFEGCENVNAIYTQSNDMNVAGSIDESIRQNNENFSETGTVDAGNMPDSSITSDGTDESYTQTTVKETDNSVISVSKTLDETKETTNISAVVENSDGWSELKNTVDDVQNGGVGGNLEVKVQLPGSEISGEDLGKLSGENITLVIRAEDESTWKVDMSEMEEKDFSGKYVLGAEVEKIDAEQTTIESEQVYQVTFDGNTDFCVTVGLNVGNARQNATLYQKKGGSYEAVQTVMIDDSGNAWFSLANIDAKTKYYIGINAAGLESADVVIPDTLTEEYGIDYTLTDAEGTQYKITGRTSRWGITGKQFAIYVAIAVVLLILLIAAIMFTIHKFAKMKEQYPPSEDDNPIDEEALRLQVMQELLEEAEQKKDKDTKKQ